MRRRTAWIGWALALALAACGSPEVCDDGGDNDGDGNIDCNDSECSGVVACVQEICDDNSDNNANGLFDCLDPDCAGSPVCLCGNDTLDTGENCDGDNLGGADCTSIGGGFIGGVLACADDCSFDTSACTQADVCGDGVRSGNEQCDDQDLGGEDCESLGFDRGVLSCAASCTFDLSACINDGAVCGDGIVALGEQCDDGNTTNGDGCNANCQNEGLAQCGDGLINVLGEQCDDGNILDGDGCQADCTLPECNDGLDNDNDGEIDAIDLGCTDANDDSERSFSETCDGVGGPVFDSTVANPANTIFTVNGNTAGGDDLNPTDLSGDCTTATGPELILRYAIPEPLTLTFDLDFPETNFDTVLYVREGSCGSTVETCNDNIAAGNARSKLTKLFPAGDLFVIVDGFNGASGTFKLRITPQ
jgi:cysteine-rich repeat protein